MYEIFVITGVILIGILFGWLSFSVLFEEEKPKQKRQSRLFDEDRILRNIILELEDRIYRLENNHKDKNA